MKLSIEQKDTEAVVRISGELDTVSTTEHAADLQQVLALADRPITVDCTDMEYISSAGLRFFMQLKRESDSHGGKVTITHLNEDVSDIFRMSGFQNIFEIE